MFNCRNQLRHPNEKRLAVQTKRKKASRASETDKQREVKLETVRVRIALDRSPDIMYTLFVQVSLSKR